MLAGVPLIVGLGHVEALPLQSRSQFRQAALSTDTLPNCNLSTVFSTGNLFVPQHTAIFGGRRQERKYCGESASDV